MTRAAFALTLSTLVACPAFADTLPARKPGLWETSMSAMPSMKVKQCIDEKTDKLAESAAAPGATCTKREIRKVATGYEIESSCTISGINADTTGLISGDFETFIKIDLTTTIKGIPGMPAGTAQKSTIENRRIGNCEAGQKPGDMIMPDGRVIKTPGT
jgi:hypothetical protein